MKHLLLAALTALALSCNAGAADKKDEKKDKSASESATAHTLADFKIGALITGPEVKLEDLKGKAVVIEPGADWKVIRVNDLKDGCKATFAPAGDKMYVRTYGMLYCFARKD